MFNGSRCLYVVVRWGADGPFAFDQQREAVLSGKFSFSLDLRVTGKIEGATDAVNPDSGFGAMGNRPEVGVRAIAS